MNRSIFTIAALLISTLLWGQKAYQPTNVGVIIPYQTQQNDDTLFGNFLNGTPVLYAAQSVIGGYASGNNGFGDKAKAQVYSIDNVCGVKGAIVWMAAKKYTSGNPNSKLNVNLYEVDFNSQVTGQGLSALKLRPDSLYLTESIAVSDIDTAINFNNGANVVLFDTQLYFDSLFAVGIDFDSLAAGDTVACYTTTNGDADSTERAWEKDANGNWFTMFRNWGLNVDFAIFPIVDCTQTGIAEDKAGFGFDVYPNPAADNMVINLSNNRLSNYAAVMVNSLGQTVHNSLLINNITQLNIQHLPAGIYYIIVYGSDKKGYAKPIIIK